MSGFFAKKCLFIENLISQPDKPLIFFFLARLRYLNLEAFLLLQTL
jgi:hypothetical protein